MSAGVASWDGSSSASSSSLIEVDSNALSVLRFSSVECESLRGMPLAL
jgi:hypothetical protein